MARTRQSILLAAALLSLLAALSSTAGAVTWHNDGNTNFFATGTPTTLSGTGGSGIVCPGDLTMSNTISAGSFPGTILTTLQGTIRIGAVCTLGVSGWSGDCRTIATLSSWQAGPPAVTSGFMTLTCTYYLANTPSCHLEGKVDSHYVNPVSPSTFGKLTLTTGGDLTVTNAAGVACPLGSKDKVHLSETTFIINGVTGGTGTLGPIITRTP